MLTLVDGLRHVAEGAGGIGARWASLGALLLLACGGETTGAPGTGTGGSAGAGGSGGTAGSGGNGGGSTLPTSCRQPADPGTGQGYVPSYAYDAAAGVCEPFVYAGSGGNDNRFDTLDACQGACDGGASAQDHCVEASDCALTSVSCCGACDPVRIEDLVAVVATDVDSYRTIRGCTDVVCEACQYPDPATATHGYFAATCRAGRCQPVDVRETDVTACGQDADCFLRLGSGCCESCDPADVVAIANAQALSALVCGSGPAPCPMCMPQLPQNLVAACDAGKCVVRSTGP